MESYFVGLDVHSRESVFAIQQGDVIVGKGTVPTSRLGLRRLREENSLPAQTPVALESGTSAFFVARELANLGLKPVVVDAYEVRRKARRPLLKSDRRDALELCHGVSRGVYQSGVHVPGPEITRTPHDPLASTSLPAHPDRRGQRREAAAARCWMAGRPAAPEPPDRSRMGPVASIHRGDQGCQYTSIAFGLRCREAGVQPSMGSVGDCTTMQCVRASSPRSSASYSIASASAPRARRGSRSSTSSRASTILDGGTRHSAISRRSSSSVRRQPADILFEPGVARVDPLRGRVSQGLQERNQRESTMNARGRSQAFRCPPKRGSSKRPLYSSGGGAVASLL